jgi:DNA primase
MTLTIAQVLEHYGADVSRVRETGWRPIRCPFHDDRVSSASVNLENNAFCCHACDARGDAIGVIRRAEHMDYRSAVEWATNVLGASVSNVRESTERTNAKRRQRWRDRLLA